MSRQLDRLGGASGPTGGGGQHTDSRPIVLHETGCAMERALDHGHVQWLHATESGTSGQQPPAAGASTDATTSARTNRR